MALAGLVVLAGRMPAMAASLHTPPSDSFEIGIQGEYYQYREPDFAKLDGPGFGVDGTYTYNWDNWFVRANALVAFYNLDYSSNGTGSQSGIYAYKPDLRGMFGYTFKLDKKGSTVAPYLGIGYRMLFDADGEKLTSTGAVGYDRRSQYLYAPIGVGFAFNAGHWGFRTYGEYDFLLQGWQTSYFSDLGFDNNLTNKQNAGYGLRAGFMVAPPVDFHNLSIGPYMRYWNIHESDVQNLYFGGVPVASGLEPQNNTLEYGLEASIRFR
jgi:hypothetical protein